MAPLLFFVSKECKVRGGISPIKYVNNFLWYRNLTLYLLKYKIN